MADSSSSSAMADMSSSSSGVAAAIAAVPLTDNPSFSGDVSWMLISSALVFFMTPGLALFYGGLARTKSALNLMTQSMVAIGVITVQWFVIGYTLSFSPGGKVYGDLSRMFFSSTGLGTSHPNAGTVPEELFCMYQLMFAIITPALITGATADRFRFSAYLLFLVAWSTLVYDPVAHMVWHPEGWMNKWGVMDFAGGIVVHAIAATSALVACLMLGARDGYPDEVMAPHSAMLVVVGTGILWFGWFGFNAGSSGSAGFQAVTAFVNSQLAGSFAGMAWMFIEWLHAGKPSAIGLCVGYVAGLATITPPSGYVGPLPAMAIGVVAALVGYGGVLLRKKFSYDDALDVFAVHGLASSSGVLLVGIFADATQTGSNPLQEGWINHKWSQLGIQAGALAFCMAWAAIATFVILTVINFIPGLGGIRVSEAAESVGLDLTVHGEPCYSAEEGRAAAEIVHTGKRDSTKGVADSAVSNMVVPLQLEGGAMSSSAAPHLMLPMGNLHGGGGREGFVDVGPMHHHAHHTPGLLELRHGAHAKDDGLVSPANDGTHVENL